MGFSISPWIIDPGGQFLGEQGIGGGAGGGFLDETFGWNQEGEGGTPDYMTSFNQSEPWGPQQPYLKKGFAEAERVYDEGYPEYYQGNMIAPQSQATLDAQQMTADRARAGSPLVDASQAELQKTISGGYLGEQNPYYDDAMNYAFSKARTPLDAQFADAGRYGGGLHQQGLGETYGGIAAMYADQNYQNERARQIEAMNYVPAMAGQDYVGGQMLAGVGVDQENFAQEQINADKARYDWNSMRDQMALADYMSAIQGGYGGQTTSRQQVYDDRGSGMLGGALAGAQIGSQYGGWGTAAGAGIGGLLGSS